MTPYLSAATKAATARRALLLLALLALIAAGTIMGYFSVLDLAAINRATEEDATRAFGTVRTANLLLLIVTPAVWFFALRWLRASLRNAHALGAPHPAVALAKIDRAVALSAIPGPLLGQPGRLLVRHTLSLAEAHGGTGASRPNADSRSARWAGRLSLLVAPLWLGGLISSHTDRTAMIWVAVGWVTLSAVAVLLRQTIAKVQLSEELQSALLTAEQLARARMAR
ncbi:MAG: hypothetical protein NTW70_01590 [Chloroflexi bacterium]|nr:hypothetical protein [Chloroflexota bacterium]